MEKQIQSLLLKVYQIGSITKAIGVHHLAKSNGCGTMGSHWCGETKDSFIEDCWLTVYFETAVEKQAFYCLLLKVYQIGSITEAIQAHQLAKSKGEA